MEFLYKLYDMEYFAVGLLIVIAILVFLFLLILFFGKKEENERKLEETKKLELEKNGFKEVEEVKEELKVPEIPQPVLEPVVESEVQKEVPTFENPFVKEELKVEQSNNEVELEIPAISENETSVEESKELMYFDLPIVETKNDETELNSFVSDVENNVVEEKEEVKNMGAVLPKIDIDNLFQTNTEATINKEVVEEIPNIEPINLMTEEVKVETPKVEAPFSSVYTNNELPKKNNNVFELPKFPDFVTINLASKSEHNGIAGATPSIICKQFIFNASSHLYEVSPPTVINITSFWDIIT